MKLIERYIFLKVASATALTFIALGAMVWLSQALRQFDLVTANGQAITTFLQISSLLIPVLITVVFPVSLLIAVIYTFNSMNTDSELVVINASGARQSSLLKPVLLMGLIATVIVASMTLYFAPLSYRTWQTMITGVRGNIVGQFMREGTFVTLAPKLTFHIRSRETDGSMRGLFVSDDREADKSSTYLAEAGALLDNPLGLFLIMSNGTIQQRDKLDGSISMIEFSSYAFDLSTLRAAERRR
jgi:lipopolysaccharide export system permease protein